MTCSSWLPEGVVDPLVAFFEFVALVNQQRHVAAVVDHQLRPLAALVAQRLVGAFPVVFEALALPREDRNAARRDRRRRVILRREDVAAGPADFGAERDQRLDQHRGLNGHVQRAGDPARPSAAFPRNIYCGSTSDPASRARQLQFPCGPNRPAKDLQLCIRSSSRVEEAIQFSLYRRIVIY